MPICDPQVQIIYKIICKPYLPREPIRMGSRITISDNDITKMRELATLGNTQNNIAKQFGVNPATVSKIINKIRRKEIRYACQV